MPGAFAPRSKTGGTPRKDWLNSSAEQSRNPNLDCGPNPPPPLRNEGWKRNDAAGCSNGRERLSAKADRVFSVHFSRAFRFATLFRSGNCLFSRSVAQQELLQDLIGLGPYHRLIPDDEGGNSRDSPPVGKAPIGIDLASELPRFQDLFCFFARKIHRLGQPDQ